MKKKILSLALLLSVTASAFAEEVKIGGLWYKLVSMTKEAKVIQYKNDIKYSGNIVIPETVKYEGTKYSVTSIGKWAFRGCTDLESIRIPNSVTNIEDYAFYYCSGIFSVTIPNSVMSIGEGAFDMCSGLTSVAIPNSVTSIGGSVFAHCSSLTSITIPNSVTSIGNHAFNSCSSLTSVTIPNSVVSIGNYAFLECSGLTSVTFGNRVISIGGSAFEFCNSLTSVTIPKNVTNIEGWAFADCSNLTTIIIGSGVNTIGNQAFAGCPELTNVLCYAQTIPSTKGDAFAGSYIENATLYVPPAYIGEYEAREPWKSFKTIVGIDETMPETPKCATPTIAFVDGKLKFSCETESVEYVSEVTVTDAKKNYSSEVSLTGIYKVSVYATKAGYDNSDVATMEFTLGAGGEVCDVNKDGQVDVADIATIISRMAGK